MFSVFHAKVGGLLMLVTPYILYFSKGKVSTLANVFSTKTFMEGIKNFQIFTNKCIFLIAKLIYSINIIVYHLQFRS